MHISLCQLVFNYTGGSGELMDLCFHGMIIGSAWQLERIPNLLKKINDFYIDFLWIQYRITIVDDW